VLEQRDRLCAITGRLVAVVGDGTSRQGQREKPIAMV
jgi:hypothetical protein